MTTGCVGRRAAGLGAACIALTAVLLPSPAAGQTYRAVLAGASEYLYINNLEYCDDDVRDMRDLLLQDARWTAGNMTVLTDGEPQLATYANIQSAIADMAGVAGPGDVCLFYFSGHGESSDDVAPLDEADGLDEYLCPYDTSAVDYSASIRDDDLKTWISAITGAGATMIVILDTCNSGGNLKGVSRGAVKGIGAPRQPTKGDDGFAADLVGAKRGTKDLQELPNIVVLTACDDWEESVECPEYENGLFTHYLLEGATSGITDSNGDGVLSAEEMWAYTAPRAGSYWYWDTEKNRDWRQHAQIFDADSGSQTAFLEAPPQSPDLIASVDMDTDPGWAAENQWAWGTPSEMTSPDTPPMPGPTSGHTGAYVYGYNLTGDYADFLSDTYLTSTAFDCSDYRDVKLRFRRWLGVEQRLAPDLSIAYDRAFVEVSGDGSSWTLLWQNKADFATSDTEWIPVEYALPAWADDSATIYVRWGMASDESVTFCGWNIDDVEIVGRWGVEIAGIPASFDRECVLGYNPSPVTDTFDVWNSGIGTLTYTITDDADAGGVDWVSCSPENGTSTGEHDTITITYSTATIAAEGTYNATITISDGISDLLYIPVAMAVTRPTIATDLASATITQYTIDGADGEPQTFDIWNSGTGVMQFTISDDVSGSPDWISVSPPSGETLAPGEHVAVTVTYDSDTLALNASPGYQATITISDPAADNDPLLVDVVLVVDVDSDDDGLCDLAEVNVHGTDPTKQDSDGDGFSDGDEVTAGTNPNLASDHPPVPPPPRGGGCAGGGGASPASATVLAVLVGLVLALRARTRLAAAPAARPDRS